MRYLLLFLAAAAGALEPLPYRHPGLIVDLGVGLWAWPVPADADGDGDFDLLVSCPDKPSNGVYFFENTTGDTAKNPRPVFRKARRLSGTVHYVMPSYVDGKLRVLSPGWEYPDFIHTGTATRVALPVSPKFYTPRGPQSKGPKVRHHQWRLADYDGDGRADLIAGMEDWSWYGWDDAWNERGEWQNGPLHGFVFVFPATGAGTFGPPMQVEAGGAPVDTYGCPSPNFADFDGDGDLDLLAGEFLDGFTYFENEGTRTQPRYAAGRRLPVRMDLQMIVPVAFDWDRDGDVDLIVGDEDGRVALVENTGRLEGRTPVFAAPFYFQQEADTLKCGALATPVGVDWDGDGDEDIVSGNTAGYVEFFENLSGSRVALPQWAAPRRLEVEGRPFRIMAGPTGSIQGPAEAKWGYTTFSVADWDGDGRRDIVLNSIWGRVQWLRNLGGALAPPQPVEVAWPGAPPRPAWTWWTPQPRELATQWRTTPVAVDWDQDGALDLVMLDHEGYLCLWPRDGAALRPPRRAFLDEKGAPLRLTTGAAGKSGRRKLCAVDWDGDGQLDLLLNSANATLLRTVERRGDAWVMQDRGPLAPRNIEGHDVSPTTVDFDGDGVRDFLGGAEDGRLYLLKNPRSP